MSQYGRTTVLDNQRKSMAFTFKKRTEKVDWRKLAAIDVNRIARELDFAGLQESIMSVTFCDIEAEMDSHLVDPNFVKLFQLSQLIIEYLMHSQQFLQSKINEMESTSKENSEGLEKMNKDLEEKQNSVNHLKKENRKARKMLAEYQLMIRSGASGMHKCPFCPKVFVSNDYLLAHIPRRHSEHGSQFVGALKDSSSDAHRGREHNATINDDLLRELKDIKERMISTERQLQKERESDHLAEKEDKELEKIKELEERYAQWKTEEQQRQMNEMTEFKNSVMMELRQVHEQKTFLEQRIVDLQQKSVRPSIVRGIQDEDEIDAPSRKQQSNEVELMQRQLQQEVSSVHSHAQEEMKKLNNKWKKKEIRSKREKEEEKEKYESILKQFNEALEAERIEKQKMAMEFEQQMKKLEERDRLLEKPAGRPPQPLSRDEVEDFEQDASRSPSKPEAPQEDDTITLYVAFNGTNYQVRRSPSASSRDWSDQFSFNACLRPQQGFNCPIYVYSAGGSPYWRQYISTRSSPPSTEYHFDYVFHVASVPLARTIAYHVLECGSVPVIKSCISRTPEMKGWRETGIVFYVLKPVRASSPPKALNRSGTFMSDTFTDGEDASDSDEISVSSLNTATESAKKNLAEAIQINRSKMEEPLERSLPPPPPPPPPEEENDSETEDQSETDWGTTLETGTFRPFENFPEITTRYNHKKDTLDECKQEFKEIFEQSLGKRGIQPGTSRLSSKQLESRMESFRSEQEGNAKKFKNFREIRKRKAEEVDAMAREMSSSKRPGKSGNESRGTLGQQKRGIKSSFKSAAAAIGAARELMGRGSKANSKNARTITSSPGDGTAGSVHNRSLVSTEGSFTATSITEQSVSDESELEEDNRKVEREVTLTDEGSDEDTDWDSAMSGNELPIQQTVPKVSVNIPSQRSQVQELASSLEKSLESSAEIKKPVGAVALIHSTPASSSKRPASKVELEDFNDDSEFLSSSPEPDDNVPKYPGSLKRPMQSPGPKSNVVENPGNTPKKGVKFKMDNYSDFDDSDLDIENIT